MKYKSKQTNVVNFIYLNLGDLLAKFFVKTFLTPNQISMIGFFFGILAVYFFATGQYIDTVIAVFFLQISILLDFVDGRVARARSVSSKYGEFLELVTDHIEYPLILGAVTYGVYLNYNSDIVLFMGFGLVIILTMIQKINDFHKYNSRSSSTEYLKRTTKPVFMIRFIKAILSEFGLGGHTIYFFISVFALMDQLHLFLVIMSIYAPLCFLKVIYSSRRDLIRQGKQSSCDS